MRRLMKSAVAAAIAVCALVVSTPADAQLRPKVKVLTTATTPVPTECAEGTVAPPPRVEVTPPPPMRVPETPLRGTLSTSLRAVQQAAERDDYAGFKDALANARAAVAAHERGGERDAAEDVLAVYRDVERLWDYAQTSATGAFFSADDRELMDAARRYGASTPVNVGGATLYATRETRQAVTRAASDRLARIGIHVTSRSTSHTDTSAAERAPTRVTRATASHSTPRATHRETTHSTTATSHTAVTHMARAVPAPQPRPVSPVPAPLPAPVAPAPAPQPAPVAPAPAPMPAPITTETQPATTTAPLPAPDTASTETGAFSTATDATTTTATTSSAPAPRPTPTGTTNLILRIIVVLIAIGLLVALFRASS